MNAAIPQAPRRRPEAPTRGQEAPAAAAPFLLRIDVSAGPELYVRDVLPDGRFTVAADLARAMRFDIADPALLALVAAEASKWPLSPVASYVVEGP